MSTPIASPRGVSSDAEDDEGTLLAKAAGKPAHVSAARKLAQNKQSGNTKRDTDGETNDIRSGKHNVKCIIYEMAEFLQSCVER